MTSMAFMRRSGALALAICLGSFGVQAQAPSVQQVERLAMLGKTWGFLKYNHAGIAVGTVDWDSALVATVPRVKAARTNAEFRSALQALLDAAGPITTCARPVTAPGPCRAPGPDSLRRNIDLRWMEDTATLGGDIAGTLRKVRDNPTSGPHRYFGFQLTAMFLGDSAYNAPAYPDEAVRLLSLYRFWNDVRWFFPYLDINGGDWNDVLREFVPRMIAAADTAQYHLAVAELTSRVNDAHASAGSRVLSNIWGFRYPAFEARSVEGKIVVWKLASDTTLRGELKRGDVITHVDGEPVATRRRDLSRYVAAGNDAVRERKLVSMVLRGKRDYAAYTVERDGKSLEVTVPMARAATGATAMPTYPVSEQARILPGSTIGYISLGDLNVNQVDSAMAIVRGTSGLVLDVRNYPRGTMYAIANHLNLFARPFVKFTAVDATYPGQLVWRPSLTAGRAEGNPTPYSGRIAILVDERTQSHAEFTTMALQTAPGSKVIGSQTAGADGNVTYITLPGNIRTLFTGLGVFYPDGRPTQRIGIVPDIVVRPTIAGVRAGKDEVLDRAIEYLKSGR